MSDNQRAEWMEKAAERIVNDVGVARNIPYTVDGHMLSAADAVAECIRDAYSKSEEAKECERLYSLAYAYPPSDMSDDGQTWKQACELAEQQLASANARCAAMREAMPDPGRLRQCSRWLDDSEWYGIASWLREMAERIDAAQPTVEQKLVDGLNQFADQLETETHDSRPDRP